jgi:hypothetical protein
MVAAGAGKLIHATERGLAFRIGALSAGQAFASGAGNFAMQAIDSGSSNVDWGQVQQAARFGAAGAVLGQAFYAATCFETGTPMLWEHGHKKVEEFKERDRLWARNEFDPDGPLELKEIEEIFIRRAVILEVTVSGQRIGTTAEHPFYAYGKGWTPAGELANGDQLLSADGRWLSVEKVYNTGRLETVYNFRIAEHHTYFVGGEGWGFGVWVHNANRTYLVGAYNKTSAGPGSQMHHLLQQKAFLDDVNDVSGAVVRVLGKTGKYGTQHNLIHRVLEGFWEPHRQAVTTPTNRQYLDALGKALRFSGFTPKETFKLVDTAQRYLVRLGYSMDGLVPNVPGRFPDHFLPGGPITL